MFFIRKPKKARYVRELLMRFGGLSYCFLFIGVLMQNPLVLSLLFFLMTACHTNKSASHANDVVLAPSSSNSSKPHPASEAAQKEFYAAMENFVQHFNEQSRVCHVDAFEAEKRLDGKYN